VCYKYFYGDVLFFVFVLSRGRGCRLFKKIICSTLIIVGFSCLSDNLSQVYDHVNEIYSMIDDSGSDKFNLNGRYSKVVENYLASEDVKLLSDACDELFIKSSY
jgi:hypothetical protein